MSKSQRGGSDSASGPKPGKNSLNTIDALIEEMQAAQRVSRKSVKVIVSNIEKSTKLKKSRREKGQEARDDEADDDDN